MNCIKRSISSDVMSVPSFSNWAPLYTSQFRKGRVGSSTLSFPGCTFPGRAFLGRAFFGGALSRALLRETLGRGALGVGGAEVGVEVEAEEFFDLRGDGRQHDLGEAGEFGDDVLAGGDGLAAAARARLLTVVEGARDAEADEDADGDGAS